MCVPSVLVSVPSCGVWALQATKAAEAQFEEDLAYLFQSPTQAASRAAPTVGGSVAKPPAVAVVGASAGLAAPPPSPGLLPVGTLTPRVVASPQAAAAMPLYQSQLFATPAPAPAPAPAPTPPAATTSMAGSTSHASSGIAMPALSPPPAVAGSAAGPGSGSGASTPGRPPRPPAPGPGPTTPQVAGGAGRAGKGGGAVAGSPSVGRSPPPSGPSPSGRGSSPQYTLYGQVPTTGSASGGGSSGGAGGVPPGPRGGAPSPGSGKVSVAPMTDVAASWHGHACGLGKGR